MLYQQRGENQEPQKLTLAVLPRQHRRKGHNPEKYPNRVQ